MALRVATGDLLELPCRVCKEQLLEIEFHLDLARTCRRQTTCKACTYTHNREYVVENRDKLREWDRARRKRERVEQPERVAERKRRGVLRRKYGLTTDQYDEMVAGQGGRCAICGELPQKERKLCVDHCHATGAVRGLLCNRCNTSLGQFEDRVDLLQSASAYLERTRQIAVP